MHPDCTYTKQSLPLYSGGDMSRAALARVDSHVRQCKACAGMLQRAKEARQVLVLGVQARAEGPVPSLLPQLHATPVVVPTPVAQASAQPPVASSRLRLVRWASVATAAGVLGFLALRVPQLSGDTAGPQEVARSQAALVVPIPVQVTVVAPVDGDALRPLQASEMPLRHSATRTIEVPWMENNAGRVLTPGGSVATVGWTTR